MCCALASPPPSGVGALAALHWMLPASVGLPGALADEVDASLEARSPKLASASVRLP
jgi:hypothetical protein